MNRHMALSMCQPLGRALYLFAIITEHLFSLSDLRAGLMSLRKPLRCRPSQRGGPTWGSEGAVRSQERDPPEPAWSG